MKLKDIIEDADLYMPNSLSPDRKIRFFNELQKSLYRDFPAPVQSDMFTTDPGVSYYEIFVQPEHVIGVYIGNEEYRLKLPQDPDIGKYYAFLNDELFIQPTPTTLLSGYILYKAEPEDVTDLEAEPKFLKDYPEIFSLGIAKKMALIAGKYQEAGELEARFQNLVRDASLITQKGKLRRIRQVRRWS